MEPERREQCRTHTEGPTVRASYGGGGGRGRAASELMGAGLQSGGRGYDRFFFLIHRTQRVGREPLTFLHLSI